MHSLELLEEKLAGIRDVDSHDFCTALELSLSATVASILFSALVGHCLVAASFAYENSVKVRDLEKSFSEELGCSVGDHAVSLHLSESEAAISRSSFSGLLVEILKLSSGPCMDLVSNHVLESLVVSWAEENLGLYSLSCKGIVETLVSVLLITQLMKFPGDVFWSEIRENGRVGL